jgi:hypothetical protein
VRGWIGRQEGPRFIGITAKHDFPSLSRTIPTLKQWRLNE